MNLFATRLPIIGLAVISATLALAAPGEVVNVQWCAGSKTCLQWDPEASATQYRVYRGERGSFPCLLNPSVESCDDGTYVATTTSNVITDDPPAGGLFWFLVTAENGTGEGTPGAATSGARLKNVSGACLPACGVAEAPCSVDADCCSASCIAGTCQAVCCQPTDAFCTTHSDCCSGSCSGGQCQAACSTASQCPGSDTDCQQRTCVAGQCGLTLAPMDSPCSQNGGTVCSATGQCVQCNGASQCPGADTECAHRTCSANSCGVFYFPNGAQSPVQTPGDCLVNVCDGTGGVTIVVNVDDTPFDGNDCTHDVCNDATPENSPEPAGTPCNQNGGSVCNGIESTCVVPPQIVSTSPANGSSAPATATISVTFNHAMDPMSLTAQMSAGACAGTLQVSLDNFASCVAFNAVAAGMSGGNTIATIVARPGLLLNRTFKLRVTTLARDASGVDLPSTFTLATGFTTTGGPNFCDGSIVISQIYGGGGNTSAIYKNDFIELHNRGTAPLNVAGFSVQYASATGSVWAVTNLSGSIAAGGYYLIQEGSGGTNGATLPTPNAIGTTNLSATTGKIAFVASTTSLPLGCTLSGVFDFVGYGATANCNEGGANSPAGANDFAISRNQGGCGDLDQNDSDFAASVPNPRNGASNPKVCACVSQNETGSSAEADYCAVNFPLSLTVQTGSPTGAISGQVYETSVTETAGASPLVRAQLGYGPPTSNPEYQAGWIWFDAPWNAQVGDYDEYHASLIAPAVGSYRYVYRVSIDQGVSWMYCDNNQGDLGAGSDAGLTFDLENQAVLTVTP